MDVVADLKETKIRVVLQPTIEAFVPLLEKKREEIQSIKRKTFKYGDTDRQQVDVYYPTESVVNETSKPPILVFAYGGGFVSGNRIFPPPLDLAYQNLGAFFAKLGFITVIPDYRLVPEVQFPRASEDVRDALVYVVQNVTEANTSRIFLLGHSAGAVNVASLIFSNDLLQSTTLKERIKGVCLFGCPYSFQELTPEDPVYMYYGSSEAAQANSPLALLKSASADTIASLPPIVVNSSEREPPDLFASRDGFLPEFEKITGKKLKSVIGKGHNHISPNWALYTGQGEDWAYELAEWFKAQA